VKKEKEEKSAKTPQKTEDGAKKEKSKLLDSNGKFAKGHKKVGGRTAGTKNRNSNIRDRLKEQVEPFINNIAENLIKVQKEEGTAAMLSLQEKFMPYFMPKYSSMSLSADQDRPISEEERLLELDGMYTKKELSINFKTMTVVNNDKLRSSDPDADEDDFDLSVFDTTDE
jgi:hypothetical protein